MNLSAFIDPGISALGSIASAGIGAFAAGHSAYQQYQYQRKLQEQAADLNFRYNTRYSRWSSKYGPSYNRQGLEKAGYNPLLALGNIGSSSSLGSVTSAGSAGMPDYGEAVNNAFQALNYKKERQEANSRIELNNSTTRKTNAEQYRQSIENYYLPSIQEANIANIKSNTALQEMQTTAQMLTNKYLPDKMKAEIYAMYKNAESNAIGAQASMVSAGANVTSAKASMISSKANETSASAVNYDKERYDLWRRNHPYQEGFLYGAGQYFGTAGKIFNGSAGVSYSHKR